MNAKAACSGSLSGLAASSTVCKKSSSWVVLRDAEKIVLMHFSQVKSYLVYVLLYHIAAKAVIINMGGDKLS